MTNLTSEQYRDILHNVEGSTEETPNVLNLLRSAVTTFYESFGCYPEVASASPGSVTIFGEQTQFDEGLTLTLPTPMATVIVGRRVSGYRVSLVTSAQVGKPHKLCFALTECPLAIGDPIWVNYLKGVMAIYCCRRTVTAFQAAIESSIPLGVGLGSAAALEVAMFTFLEIMFGETVHPIDKGVACRHAEENFLDRTLVGPVPRLCSSTAKDRHAMLIDTMTTEIDWMPFRHDEVVLIAIDSHLKDLLFGYEYPERTKCLKKACDILGVENLRCATEEDVNALEERVRADIKIYKDIQETEGNPLMEMLLVNDEWPEKKLLAMVRRARFYVMEMKRIEEATEAWNEGDVEKFGQKMTESHRSLKKDYGFSHPVLEFFVETSLQATGVLGSKMIGIGLDSGGGAITLVYKKNLQDFAQFLIKSFQEHRAELLKALQEKLARASAGFDEDDLEGQEEEANDLDEQNQLDKEGEKQQVPPPEDESKSKKKKKCDPSKKRKNRINTEERLRLLAEEEEAERLRKLREEEEAEAERRRLEAEEEEAALAAAAAAAAAAGKGEEDDGLKTPTLYIINPIAGARMLFPVKTDLLRSRFAVRVPQPKELIRRAMATLYDTFTKEAEAIGLAPATTTLFGEFLEYHSGYIIAMALPLLTVTLGCRNDTAFFQMKTTSAEVRNRREFKAPVPCAGTLELQMESWINHAVGTAAEFKGHVPGFVSVVESSVPCEVGLHSCAAFQGSIYEFLEALSRECTMNPLEKAERCRRGENRFAADKAPPPSKCSSLKFIPTFLCKEGYVLLINCKTLRMANYYLDHPSYAFLIACCREKSSGITAEDIVRRTRLCQEAAELIGKDSLINADERHIRCLRKRGASEEMIKRAKYVVSEQERCVRAIAAIKDDNYEYLGAVMTESHVSLRNDFEVSNREIEVIVSLALSVDGVLGAKLVGKGLSSTVLILSRLASVDNCIRHVRRNYVPKYDKPFFYVFRPSSGAYTLDVEEVKLIP